MANLTKAIMLAAQYHEGQTDKGGNPYVFHPLRLMLKAYGETEQIVAALHDTIEDTELTLPLLREAGFSETIIEAVDALSRRKKESYEDFILRIKDNPLARRVKVYDLQDNMDLTRINKRTEKDKERLKKYSRALDVLLGGDLPEKAAKASKADKPGKTDKSSKADKKAKKAQADTVEETVPRAEELGGLPEPAHSEAEAEQPDRAETEQPGREGAEAEASVSQVAAPGDTPAQAADKPARKPRTPRTRKPAGAVAPAAAADGKADGDSYDKPQGDAEAAADIAPDATTEN